MKSGDLLLPFGQPNVGDLVCFTGNMQFYSSSGDLGKPAPKGLAVICDLSDGAHAVKLTGVAVSGCTVDGWVDPGDVCPLSALPGNIT